jgi:hypothetical protein
MTETLTRIEVNCTTGEETIIPLSPEEIAEREADSVASARAEANRQTAEQALSTLRASAKAKLIAGTPLTAEEADTLVI